MFFTFPLSLGFDAAGPTQCINRTKHFLLGVPMGEVRARAVWGKVGRSRLSKKGYQNAKRLPKGFQKSPFNHKKYKKGLPYFDKPLILLVPGARIELASPCGRRILSPLRLPVPPSRQSAYQLAWIAVKVKVMYLTGKKITIVSQRQALACDTA